MTISLPTPIASRNRAILKAREILANPDKYVAIDTETTGVGALAEVIELSAVSLHKEPMLELYFMPSGEISPTAIATHGLTEDILKQKGTTTWDKCAVQIQQALNNKTMLAYNATFDCRMIAQTAAMYGLDSPVSESMCAMRLYQQFLGAAKPKELGGDHTALGDCLRMIDLLQEMANSNLIEDPDAIVIQGVEDIAVLQAKIDDLAAQRLAITKTEESLKSQIIEYMLKQELSAVPLGNGKQVKRYSSIKGIKPKELSVDQLPDRYKQLSINLKVIKAEWSNGTLDSDIFEFQETHSIRTVKG